jgi:hypothetical protein
VAYPKSALAAEEVDGIVDDVAFGDEQHVVEEEQVETPQP